jgi:putative peptidoglycan lipid II flippase
MGVLAPVVTFAVGRQAQVLFERYLASPLPAGAISHLNYAQKVAQMPMVLSLMVCTVTFPVVARAMADGDRERARLRVERDLALVGIVVLLGAAYVTACAPQLIQLLFQRGEFDAVDTADTASVMRVYCCGLLGHSLVGALVRPFFSGTRPPWYPAAAMGVGLLVTVTAGALAVRTWGVHGIAAANAAGILTTALLLLHGLGARVVAIDVRRVAAGLARLMLAAAVAAAAGWGAARLVAHPLAAAMAGGVAVLVVFASVAHLVRAPEMPQLVATVKRRFAHVR